MNVLTYLCLLLCASRGFGRCVGGDAGRYWRSALIMGRHCIGC